MRGPLATLVLFCVFSALSFNVASHTGFVFNQGQMPQGVHDLIVRITLVIYLVYFVPLSFVRPAVIWRQYPRCRTVVATILAFPMFMLCVLFIVAFL
jgi:hypothetical protein